MSITVMLAAASDNEKSGMNDELQAASRCVILMKSVLREFLHHYVKKLASYGD